MKKSLLESVRQISRQKPAKASVVRQPKKVYCEMIGMGVKSITIVRAVTADFFCDCWAVKIPSDERVGDVPWGVHYHAQELIGIVPEF
jgi:hypothetical protein